MNNNLINYFEDSSKFFLEAIGIAYPYNRPTSQWHKSQPYKILCYSDPHEPYSDEGLFEQSLIHKDAETVIVAGDLGDYYSKSRFRKSKSVNMVDEIREVFLRLEWLATHFKNVKIMKGNHDDRPEKRISDLFNGEADLHILTENSLLTRLASYFDNIEVVGTEINENGYSIKLSHIYQYGDIIFTHGELSRAQPTAIMQYISNYLHLWKTDLGLKPYKVIIQGHNHQAMKLPVGDELWILNPCSMRTKSIGAEYIYAPRMVGKPPIRGYTIIHQENGVTDWNKTNYYIHK